MPAVVRARVTSEDEKKSTIHVPPGVYNTAIIFMEPSTIARGFAQHQDTVRWRLSVEQTIELEPPQHDDGQSYRASFATITLPPVHHARQAVAIWYWPFVGGLGLPGRVTELTFRWESDSPRASAEAVILASEGLAGPFAGPCGLFALPYPGTTDVVRPFDARRK